MISEVLIYNKTKIPVSKKLIREIIFRSLGLMKIKQPVEAAVLIVGDKEIRRLNYVWRGKDRVTNVLSFAQFNKHELKKLPNFGSGTRKLTIFDLRIKSVLTLGEIVIDPYEILRSAVLTQKHFDDELAALVIHGLLHLVGYDHKSKREARLMKIIEEKLIRKLKN